MKHRRKDRSDGRRGIRGKALLEDLQEKRGYWKLQEEALCGTVWRNRFGKDYTWQNE
jgi:hypothetical protein